MTNLELSNALAHDAKLVLSFITQIKCRDPRDPLRSLITLRVPPLMLFNAQRALIAISYTSEKQEDDQVTDSENTFAKEMARTHPNKSLDTFIFLIILNSIWQFAAFPYLSAVRKAVKHQNNLSSKLAPLIPTKSTSAFHSTNLFLFSCHHILTNGVAALSAYKPTHNPQFLQLL